MNTRASALADIVEMLKGHPDMVGVELINIINGAGPLAFDSEKRVRIEFGSLIKLILQVVSKQRLQSQMSLLCAHISCALTHPSEAIANDGCQFADAVVTSLTSEFLVRQGTQLLCNMMCNITKRLRNYSNKAEKKSGNGRPSDSSENAVLRNQLDLLRLIHNFLNVLAPLHLFPNSHSSSECPDAPLLTVRASRAKHGIPFLQAAFPTRHVGAWSLPRESNCKRGNPSCATSSVECVHRILSQVEPLLTEFWTASSPTTVFESLRSGRPPAGGLELVLLVVKCFGAMFRFAGDSLSSSLADWSEDLLVSLSSELQHGLRLTLQCVELYHSNLKDVPRYLDLQLTLCQELTAVNRLVGILSSWTSTSLSNARLLGNITPLLVLGNIIGDQHKAMAGSLVGGLKRLSDCGGQLDLNALPKISSISAILVEMLSDHRKQQKSAFPGRLDYAFGDLDCGSLMECVSSCIISVFSLLRERSEESEVASLQAVCLDLFQLSDVAFTSNAFGRPYVQGLLDAFPSISRTMEQFVVGIVSSLSPIVLLHPALMDATLSLVITHSVRNHGDSKVLSYLSTLLDLEVFSRLSTSLVSRFIVALLGQLPALPPSLNEAIDACNNDLAQREDNIEGSVRLCW